MNKKFLIIIGVVFCSIALIGGVIVTNSKIRMRDEENKIEENKTQTTNAEKEQEDKEDKKLKAEQEAERLKQENEQKISDLKIKKDALESKEITLKLQKNEEFMNYGFTQKYYELSNELSDLTDEIWDVEREIDKLEAKTFEVDYDALEDEMNEIVDNIKDNSIGNVDSNKKSFEFSNVFMFLPIIMFITVFISILVVSIKNFRNVGSMFSGNSTKDMLNDLSDVAVKMAKELNPTYKEFKCTNCNASLDPENTDIKKCNYCGAKLYKTVDTSHKHKNSTNHSNSYKTK